MSDGPARDATVTIEGVTYHVEKLDDGNIRVTHDQGPRRVMVGPGTEGVHSFDVHPCQTQWYAYWNERLPPDARRQGGEGRDGPVPWWSSKGWKKTRGE